LFLNSIRMVSFVHPWGDNLATTLTPTGIPWSQVNWLNPIKEPPITATKWKARNSNIRHKTTQMFNTSFIPEHPYSKNNISIMHNFLHCIWRGHLIIHASFSTKSWRLWGEVTYHMKQLSLLQKPNQHNFLLRSRF